MICFEGQFKDTKLIVDFVAWRYSSTEPRPKLISEQKVENIFVPRNVANAILPAILFLVRN